MEAIPMRDYTPWHVRPNVCQYFPMASHPLVTCHGSGTDDVDGQEVEIKDTDETIKYNIDENQLKLIILFLNEGSLDGQEVPNISKGTEEKKFDIVYQKTVDNKKLTEFIDNININGCDGDQSKTQYSDLHEDHGRFPVKKYFQSYIALKKLEKYKDDIIDVVIWTNMQFDSEDLNCNDVVLKVLSDEEYENLIHRGKKQKCGEAYQIESLRKDFTRELYEVSCEFYALVKVLFEAAFFPESISAEDNEVLLSYRDVLSRETVIEKVENSLWKFHAKFVDCSQKKRTAAEIQYRYSLWMRKADTPQDYPQVPNTPTEFWNKVAESKFLIKETPGHVIPPKDQLPVEYLPDKELVQEFLSHFIFVIATKESFLESITALGVTSESSERNLKYGDFFDNVEELSMQLYSDNNILFCISDSTGLAFIKAVQILKQLPSLLFYSAQSLDSLLNKLIETEAIFALDMQFTLVVEIPLSSEELKTRKAEELMKRLCQKPAKEKNQKIVLVFRQENQSLVSAWVDGQTIKRIDLNFAFDDLTNRTQTRILQTNVKFQGTDISLEKLIQEGKLSLITEALLDKIINNIPIELGLPLHDHLGEVQNYYIKREFEHINRFSAKSLRDTFKGHNVKIYDETDSKDPQVQQNDDNQVNDLRIFFNNGRSRNNGNTKVPLTFSKTENNDERDDCQIFSWLNPKENNIVREVPHDKITVISGDAGMGKSMVLGKIALTMKVRNPDSWIILIRLVKHTSILNAIKTKIEKQQREVTIKDIIEFLEKVENLAQDDFAFGRELLTKRVTELGKITVLLDGFNEIFPDYEQVVLSMITVMKTSKIDQIWITTLSEFLDSFDTEFSYALKPYKHADREKFFTRYSKYKNAQTSPEVVNKFKAWLKKVQYRNDKTLGNALLVKLTAEVYYNNGCQSGSNDNNLDVFSPPSLYEQFTEQKFNTYFKKTTDENFFGAHKQRIIRVHQRCALQYLFPEKYDLFYRYDEEFAETLKDVFQLAIITENAGNINFIHRTFADYFLAQFLVNQLTLNLEPSKYSTQQINAFMNLFHAYSPIADNLKQIQQLMGMSVNENMTIMDFFQYQPEKYQKQLMDYFVVKSSEAHHALLTNKFDKFRNLMQTPEMESMRKEKMNFLYFEPLKDNNRQIREFMDYFLVKDSKIHQTVIADNFDDFRNMVNQSESENLRKKDKIGRMPLHLACLYKRKRMAEFLIAKDKYLMTELDNLGFGPLCYAAVRGDEFFLKNQLKFVANDAQLSIDENVLKTIRHVRIIYNEKY